MLSTYKTTYEILNNTEWSVLLLFGPHPRDSYSLTTIPHSRHSVRLLKMSTSVSTSFPPPFPALPSVVEDFVDISETWQFVTNQYEKLDNLCDDTPSLQKKDLHKHLQRQKNLNIRAIGPATIVALDFLFVRIYREAMEARRSGVNGAFPNEALWKAAALEFKPVSDVESCPVAPPAIH